MTNSGKANHCVCAWLVASRPIAAVGSDKTDATDAIFALVLTLTILVAVRPSRENVISIPRVRRNVCARRSRPARARGFFAQLLPLELPSRAPSELNSKRSDAVPVHMVRLAIIARMRLAMGSASMMLSIAALRFAPYARAKVPAG